MAHIRANAISGSLASNVFPMLKITKAKEPKFAENQRDAGSPKIKKLTTYAQHTSL